MSFTEIYGQDRAIEQLKTAFESGRMHHAILFSGPDGIGKQTLARVVANLLLCTTPMGAEPCRACGGCHRFDEGTHADYLSVGLLQKSDGTLEKMIKVDQIRALQKKLTLKSYEGGRRVIVITDADRMNPSTANALLKTLEEPPQDTVFLLTTNVPSALLPTVISRCQSLRLAPLSDEVLVHIATSLLGRELSDVEGVLEVADGSVSRLVQLLDHDMRTLHERCKSRILALRDGAGAQAVIEYAEQDASDKKRVVPQQVLELLQLWYRKNLMSRHMDVGMTNSTERGYNAALEPRAILEMLTLIDENRAGIRSNQRNARLAMEEVWFRVESMERQA